MPIIDKTPIRPDQLPPVTRPDSGRYRVNSQAGLWSYITS